MVEKYRAQYCDHKNTVLSIKWAGDRIDYVAGDCRVKAIKESTDVKEHNLSRYRIHNYTEPMTIDELRTYIAENSEMLGTHIYDCIGLTLEDVFEKVEFDEPIQVRNR